MRAKRRRAETRTVAWKPRTRFTLSTTNRALGDLTYAIIERAGQHEECVNTLIAWLNKRGVDVKVTR